MNVHDENPLYLRPHAWKLLKRPMGNQFRVADLLAAVERLAGECCPRPLLAVALHAFVTASPQQRAAAAADYWKRFEGGGSFDPGELVRGRRLEGAAPESS